MNDRNTCTDPRIGRLLHDYELGWLSEEEVEQFELHAMDCRYCFTEMQGWKGVAGLLKSDETIRETILNSAESENVVIPFRARVWAFLWPKGSHILKPAIAYLMIIILLPFAYLGIRRQVGPQTEIRFARVVDLISTRGIMPAISQKLQGDVILNFAYDEAAMNNRYHVMLKSETDEIFYDNDEFSFDDRQSARLVVPSAMLSQGKYSLIISDRADTTVFGGDTLYFRVE